MDMTAEVGSLQEDAAQLGVRLRHVRLTRGLRLKDVAGRVGCSESLVSKIERGRATPSLKVLHRIVSVLDISIVSLFSPGDAGSLVKRAGERPVIQVEGLRRHTSIHLERLIPHRDGYHLLEANIHIVGPGAESDGFIAHEGEEVGYLLEGRLDLYVDDEKHVLEAGDSFHFCSSRRHRYHNSGTVPARVLWVNTPPTF